MSYFCTIYGACTLIVYTIERWLRYIASFSHLFLGQIESDDDILNVAFALNKSSFNHIAETAQLRIYLFDGADSYSKTDSAFSLDDLINHVLPNRIS